MPYWQQLSLAIAVPAIAGLLAYFNSRAGKENALMDQMQEELDRLRIRVDSLERHERARDDYIGVLRKHIADQLGPPPPPWPEGMR